MNNWGPNLAPMIPRELVRRAVSGFGPTPWNSPYSMGNWPGRIRDPLAPWPQLQFPPRVPLRRGPVIRPGMIRGFFRGLGR